MAKVKICGITNLEDALVAARAGADALGFIFYKKSPRYINPAEARKIIKRLPKFIKKVGVFVNAKEATVRRITRDLKLDILQYHGDESDSFCAKFRGFKIIKAFRIHKKICPEVLSRYDVWAYLFDTFAKDKFGGTGRNFDWQLLSGLRGIKKTVFLSGGLNPRNVNQALRTFPAQWVDACSSLERYPGKKDHNKVKRFIKKAKKCY